MADNYMGPGLTLDDVYPVGSIYMSANATDPANLFGGTWQRIQEQFLLAAGSTHAAGSTGGEFKHTLTVDEMPSHGHYQRVGNTNGTGSTPGRYVPFGESTLAITWPESTPTTETGYAGGGAAHNITPPYLAVYMWRRTA